MKRLFRLVAIFFLLIPVLRMLTYSQDELPYEKMSKSEWIFKQKTYDEVWSAAVKSLMQLKYQVDSSDKEGGIISARKGKNFLNRKVDQQQLENFQVLLEKAEVGIKANCEFTKKAGSMFQSDQSKYLLAKIAETLYGKTEKKKGKD